MKKTFLSVIKAAVWFPSLDENQDESYKRCIATFEGGKGEQWHIENFEIGLFCFNLIQDENVESFQIRQILKYH